MTPQLAKQSDILVIEDNKETARLIQHTLKRAGHGVELAYTGPAGLERARAGQFNLVILDMMLPGITGLDVLVEMRKENVMTPVLFLTVRSEVEQRVTALNLGADDYVAKPFESQELLARVEAVLRRERRASDSMVLTVADLKLDVVSRKVTRGGKEIILSALEYRLLEFFLRNKNKTFSRVQLEQEVWGEEFTSGSNIVEVYVSYIRSAINDGFELKLITTVRGEGYILEG